MIKGNLIFEQVKGTRKEERKLTLAILNREVTVEDAEKRSKELNVMFIETSAKAGHNVNVSLKRMLSCAAA